MTGLMKKAASLDLQELIDSGEQEQHDLQQFLRNVRKYTDPEELTAKILNDLVDRIVVHAPDKSSGHRKQKIEIYYKTAGIINIADEDCVALDGRLGMQNRKKKAQPFGCSATLHISFVIAPRLRGNALFLY